MASFVTTILSTDFVIGIVIAAVAGYLTRLFTEGGKLQDWSKWYHIAVKAVKLAEKAIPDDVEDKNMKKLDYALDRFCEEYETITKTTVDISELAEVSKIIEDAVRKELIHHGENR